MRDIKTKQYLSVNGLTGSFNAFFVAKGDKATALNPMTGTFQVRLVSTPILRPKAQGQAFKNWLDDTEERIGEAVLKMYRELGLYNPAVRDQTSCSDAVVLARVLNQAEEAIAEAIGQQVRLWLTWSAWHTPVLIQTVFCGSVSTAGDGMVIFRPYSDHDGAMQVTSGLTDKVRVLTGLAHLHRRLTNGWSLLQIRSNDALLHFDGHWKYAQEVKGPEGMDDAESMIDYDPSIDFSWCLIDAVAGAPIESLDSSGRPVPYHDDAALAALGSNFKFEPSFFDKHRLVSIGHPLDDEQVNPMDASPIVTSEFMLKDMLKLGDYMVEPGRLPTFELDCHKAVKTCEDEFWEAHAKSELEAFQGKVDKLLSYPRAVADCITRWITPISGQFGNAWAGLYKLDASFTQFLPGKLLVGCCIPVEPDSPTNSPDITVYVSSNSGATCALYSVVDDRSYISKYPVFVPVVHEAAAKFVSTLCPGYYVYGTNLFCNAAQWEKTLSATAAREKEWEGCMDPCLKDEDLDHHQQCGWTRRMDNE